FFPLAMARRRHRPVMQPTTFGKVILEGLIALALLPATYFLLFVALLVGLVVGGERAMPQDVLEGARYARSVSWPLLAMLLVACTVGPLAEEVFFRGFLLSALRRYLTLVPALILQAALFAVLHFQATTNQIYLFLIGLALGGVYLWRKTLWTPLFLHC